MGKPAIVKCPQCGKPVRWVPQSIWRPFCSERCKQIDLGAWASGDYRIPVAAPPDPDGTDHSGNG